jgi:hypothetical protein
MDTHFKSDRPAKQFTVPVLSEGDQNCVHCGKGIGYHYQTAEGNLFCEVSKETACEHDLLKPNCTVEVTELITSQYAKCRVCLREWTNPPYGVLATSKTKGEQDAS